MSRFFGIDSKGKPRQRNSKKNPIVMWEGWVFVKAAHKVLPKDAPKYRKKKTGILGKVIKKNKDGSIVVELPA